MEEPHWRLWQPTPYGGIIRVRSLGFSLSRKMARGTPASLRCKSSENILYFRLYVGLKKVTGEMERVALSEIDAECELRE